MGSELADKEDSAVHVLVTGGAVLSVALLSLSALVLRAARRSVRHNVCSHMLCLSLYGPQPLTRYVRDGESIAVLLSLGNTYLGNWECFQFKLLQLG